MPLDDLVSVVETLQKRIQEHGATLRENETRTRLALIDPLLRALGWDVSDPALVTPEYNVSGRWADYALLGHDGKPAATVEAKKLGESLASHRMQMLNYSNALGVDYAGLTDGNHWELYVVFQRGQLEERRILDVSIANALAHESALQLLLLWRPNLASGQPMKTSEPIFAVNPEPATAFTPAREPAIAEPITMLPTPEIATPPSSWIALSEYNPPSGTTPPAAIRFPDGSEQAIENWNDILTAVVSWLCSKRLLTGPVNSSNRRYIVNTHPLHPDGAQFRDHRAVNGTPFVAQVHGSALAMRQNSKTLLGHCGVNPADVFVQAAP